MYIDKDENNKYHIMGLSKSDLMNFKKMLFIFNSYPDFSQFDPLEVGNMSQLYMLFSTEIYKFLKDKK